MPRLNQDTIDQQASLAEYCRSGSFEIAIEGASTERLTHYRRLVFNIVRDALKRTYPLTKSLLSEKEWGNLVHDYFMNHTCVHPQVWRMPAELIDYAKMNEVSLQVKYPHLIDLLNFEWKEVEIHMMPDKVDLDAIIQPSSMEHWIINPEHKILQFSFPVHKINPNEIAEVQKGTYFCLAHRHPVNGKVHFTDLSPTLSVLLQLMYEGNLGLGEAIDQLNEELDLSLPYDEMTNALKSFFSSMKRKGFLL